MQTHAVDARERVRPRPCGSRRCHVPSSESRIILARGGTIRMISTTAEVREQHRFDTAALERYLRVHVTGFSGSLTVKQFRGRQSNPTYYLTAYCQASVFRRNR